MTWRPRRVRALALLAAVAVAAAGCGGGNTGDRQSAVLVPLPQAAKPHATVPHVVRADPGRLTVQITRPVRVRATPGGRVVGGLVPRTAFRSATIVPVVARRGGWLSVVTTLVPNGRVGWIAASASLVPHRTQWSVVASLRRRQVVVRDAGHVVQRFRVAVGSPATPTPTGRFAVTDKLLTDDPSSPYGCCILALSAQQPHTPQGWGGGDRIAIHATSLPETIGSAASLGCLRAPAEEARRLVRTVPLGTLVTIRA
ncbi:MAG: L,D-transpeptidase [Actinobacteria bacterium]|nr:L,D-transpeptidase [Actinomycetota bacterium]